MTRTISGYRPVEAEQATRRVTDYLAALENWGNELPEGPLPARSDEQIPERGALRRALHVVVPRDRRFALRYALQHRWTSAIRPVESRRARRLSRRAPLLLHLGSGPFRKDDWVNIDLAGHPVDLRWNLEHPLPFAADSVDGIFHEHLLEHLPIAAGFDFLCANRRLLRPGGVLRVVVPDAGAYLRSYSADGEGVITQLRPDRPSDLLAVNELFYGYTHVAMYDEATLGLLLRAAGFETIERCGFGESRLDPCPDSEHRRPESLYMEAVRS